MSDIENDDDKQEIPEDEGLQITENGQFDVKSHEVLPKMYLAYALSVIKERSLPDICDGLKPVARRLLFSMHEMALTYNKPTRKSARVTGDCMGKYHPHGDGSIYGTAARLVQPFTTRYPLIIGQGNFGSLEDEPAASRYTEMKLAKIADEVLADLDKQTVDFIPNYDGTLVEPKVLPTKLPLFLLNGSIGIAVGMATSAPPHNLTEVVDAFLAYIENEDITTSELTKFVKGPDFPSGAYMFNTNIDQIYETGKGSIILRAKAEIHDSGKKQNKQSIIITELPYQVNKKSLLEAIAKLYQEKAYEGIDGITDIRDESKADTRIVIELRKGVHAKTVLNTLFRRTEMQTRYSIIMRALVNNVPKMVGLRDIFKYFLSHRKDVIVRRTEFDLKVAEKRDHILQGFLIAFDNIDNVINDVKTATSVEQSYKRLRVYDLSDEQIKSILDLKVQRLAQFERDEIITEHNGLIQKISELKKILDSEDLVLQEIKRELLEVKEKYGDERKTKIIQTQNEEGENIEIDQIEEIQEEDVVVTVTRNGLVKRTPVSEYRLQNVKGRGLIGVDIKDGDNVENIFQLSTRSYTLVFTSKGLCYKMNAYDIPSLGRAASGSSILNILKLSENEKVIRVLPISDLTGKFFVIVTKKGQIKKLKAEKLQRPRSVGTMVMSLDEDDSLIDVKLLEKSNVELLLVTKNGIAIRFTESSIRASGKHSTGVRGIKLGADDYLVSANIAEDDSYLLMVTEKGYSKKTILTKFRAQKRGGRGIICMNISFVTGKIKSAHILKDDKEQFIVITAKGILIRLRSSQIHKLGRNTQGCKIQKLTEDVVAAVAYLGIIEDDVEVVDASGRNIEVDETAVEAATEIADTDNDDEYKQDDPIDDEKEETEEDKD